MEYPKIDTLFERDLETFKVILGAFRRPEFETVSRWLITEKIDGTNIRIHFRVNNSVSFGGKTDAAQIPAFLLDYLQQTFTPQRFHQVWDVEHPACEMILYGEGYGAHIQKGGGNYREGVSFRLFDVWVPDLRVKQGGWWLERANIEDIARKLEIATVPVILDYHGSRLNVPIDLVRNGVASYVAALEKGNSHMMEGIVAKSNPILFNRKGERVMWKLKTKDFK